MPIFIRRTVPILPCFVMSLGFFRVTLTFGRYCTCPRFHDRKVYVTRFFSSDINFSKSIRRIFWGPRIWHARAGPAWPSRPGRLATVAPGWPSRTDPAGWMGRRPGRPYRPAGLISGVAGQAGWAQHGSASQAAAKPARPVGPASPVDKQPHQQPQQQIHRPYNTTNHTHDTRFA